MARFRRIKQNFLRMFVTKDEIWVHYYSPETKKESKPWEHDDSPPPKKTKTILSTGKVMASGFWDV